MGLSQNGWIAIIVIVAFLFLMVAFFRKLYHVPRPSPREEDRDLELGSTRVEPVRFPSFAPAISSGQAVASASGHVGPVTHGGGQEGYGGGGGGRDN